MATACPCCLNDLPDGTGAGDAITCAACGAVVSPDDIFEVVRIPAPLGHNLAWVSRPDGPGPHSAIIWLAGGPFPGGVGETFYGSSSHAVG